MNPETFTDNFAIKDLYDAVLKFQHAYLGKDDDCNEINAIEGEKYRTLNPRNRRCFRITAALMQNVLDWTWEIDTDTTIGDIGKQRLPDLPDWVL